MTTKEQERKALEQIIDIIAGLGAGSYIGYAIDKNVIDRAKENIENDFGIMTGEVIEHAEEATRKAEQKAAEAKQEKKAAEERAEAAEREAAEYKRCYEAEAEAGKNAVNQWIRDFNTATERANEAENRAEAAEAEVIALKAKLYDYMTR